MGLLTGWIVDYCNLFNRLISHRQLFGIFLGHHVDHSQVSQNSDAISYHLKRHFLFGKSTLKPFCPLGYTQGGGGGESQVRH